MNDAATTPVIVSACRTPIGRYLGGLSPLPGPRLGALVIREAMRRAAVPDNAVDEVIMGNVLQGGEGQAPARQAAIHSGLPGTIPAMTINKVCGSGLKAVMLAAQAIKAGDAHCIVAGGFESMSNAPHYVYGMRAGIKAGNSELVDGMIRDGLWDSFSNTHMGNLAEYTAKKAGISRREQDEFALQSHRKAVTAMESCFFKAEIVPVDKIEKDESPRADTSLEKLAALKPSFETDGTVTAGNAPGLNDGASVCQSSSPHSSCTNHRICDGWWRTKRRVLCTNCCGEELASAHQHEDQRLRSHRGERGVRGPGARRRESPRLGLVARQRTRRRDSTRSPDWCVRRARADDAALRPEAVW